MSWSLTTPMFGVPDENSHFISSLGAVNFDFGTEVQVDGYFGAGSDCFIFQPDIPSSCYDKSWDSSITTLETTTNGYTPLFYLIASAPLHVFEDQASFLVVRLWITLVNLLILAVGFRFLFAPQVTMQKIIIGSLVVLPFPAYIVASVNPSGMAYSLAFTLSVVLLRATQQHFSRPWRWILLPFLLSFLLVRRDSIIWLLVFFAAILFTRPFRGLFKQKTHDSRRLVQLLLASSIGLALLLISGAFDYAIQFRSYLSSTSFDQLKFGLAQIYTNFLQFIGVFGWLTTPLPNEIYGLATALLSILFMLVYVFGEKTYRKAFEAIILMSIVMLVLLNALRPNYAQGRYLLPAFSFAIVFGCFALEKIDLAEFKQTYLNRFCLLWAISLTLVSGLSYLQVLKRFSLGAPSSFIDGLTAKAGFLNLPGYVYVSFHLLGVALLFLPLFNQNPADRGEKKGALLKSNCGSTTSDEKFRNF